MHFYFNPFTFCILRYKRFTGLMKTPVFIPLILVAFIISSCSLFQAKINEDFKRDDLNPAVVDSLDRFTNDAYKMNPKYTNELIVALIRSNSLHVTTAKENVKILINILSVQNSNYIDESWILAHLDTKQQKDYHREFPAGLPAQQSIEAIVQSHPLFQDSITCKAEEVDAHWAYFSATGNTKVIEKMFNSISHFYSGNTCCIRCLEWSIPSRAIQNKDVYDKLIEIRDAKCNSAENSQECKDHYRQRYIPPVSECEWRYQDFFNFK